MEDFRNVVVSTKILTPEIAAKIDNLVESGSKRHLYEEIADVKTASRTDAWFYTMIRHFSDNLSKVDLISYLRHFSSCEDKFDTYCIWKANLRYNLVEFSYLDVDNADNDVDMHIDDDYVTQEVIDYIKTLVKDMFDAELKEYRHRENGINLNHGMYSEQKTLQPLYLANNEKREKYRKSTGITSISVFGAIPLRTPFADVKKSYRQRAIETIISIAQEKKLQCMPLIQEIATYQIETFSDTQTAIVEILGKKYTTAEMLCKCIDDTIIKHFNTAEVKELFANYRGEKPCWMIEYMAKTELHRFISDDELDELDVPYRSPFYYVPVVCVRMLARFPQRRAILQKDINGSTNINLDYLQKLSKVCGADIFLKILMCEYTKTRTAEEVNTKYLRDLIKLYEDTFHKPINGDALAWFDQYSAEKKQTFVVTNDTPIKEDWENVAYCNEMIKRNPENIKYTMCEDKKFYLDFIEKYPNYVKYIDYIDGPALDELIERDSNNVNLFPNMRKYFDEYFSKDIKLVMCYKAATVNDWIHAHYRSEFVLPYLHSTRRGLFNSVVSRAALFAYHEQYCDEVIRDIVKINNKMMRNVPVNRINGELCRLIYDVEIFVNLPEEFVDANVALWTHKNISSLFFNGVPKSLAD